MFLEELKKIENILMYEGKEYIERMLKRYERRNSRNPKPRYQIKIEAIQTVLELN